MLFFGLFGRYNGDYFPYSRDYGLGYIPCMVKDCPANNGRCECISPACISIGTDGKCEAVKKMKEFEEKKDEKTK